MSLRLPGKLKSLPTKKYPSAHPQNVVLVETVLPLDLYSKSSLPGQIMWSQLAPARWTGQPPSPPSAGNRSEAGLSSNAGPARAGCMALSVSGRFSAASTSSYVRWHWENQMTSHRRGHLQCAEHRGDLRPGRTQYPEGTQALMLTLLDASPRQAWAVSFYLPLLSTWKTGT